jgi:AmmeMemoRadiSam system protein A
VNNGFQPGGSSARPSASQRAAQLALAGLCTWLISPVSAASVRQPVVAGSFYPAAPDKLAGMIDRDLAQAADAHLENIRAVIVPHAGYPFSGPVAASAFRQLKGLHFKTVVVMGPSHFVASSAASVSGASAFRTPLGDVALSPKARELGALPPFAVDARSNEYEAPEWAHPHPEVGDRSSVLVDAWEHSVEVEIPFLQRVLPEFELVPIVMGDVDPDSAASALARSADDTTLIVASSDLSHYHRYDEAQKLDRRFVDAVLKMNFSDAAHGEACGRIPILTLMYIAKSRGWTPHLVDLRNSGDTYGDKSRVVGYSAIVWTAPARSGNLPTNTAAQAPLSDSGRALLLRIAHEAVEQTAHDRPLTAPAISSIPAELREPRACFVTLQEKGELRGCIGTLVAEKPLYQAVAVAASEAASHDTRFSPVTADEAKRLHVEISVLTPSKPLAFSSPDDLLKKLQPHVDGVVLHVGNLEATFLPQVWEDIPDKKTFLSKLSEKAGASRDAWQGKNVSVDIYHVESFADR